MKHKKCLLFVTVLLAFACAGCGQQTQNEHQPKTGENAANENKELQPETGENPSDANKLFQICSLSGTVTEFTENGCTISPAKEGGKGEAIQAAPGYEDTFVSVVYDHGCTFWIAHVDIQTAKAAYETAAAKDVKKQTSLIICGDYDENDVLHASRVFIYRFEGM